MQSIEVLEKIDLCMKKMYLELMKTSIIDSKYKKTLSSLHNYYLAYESILKTLDKDIIYCLKYSDISAIRETLEKEGYIEQQKKPAVC